MRSENVHSRLRWCKDVANGASGYTEKGRTEETCEEPENQKDL
jgi:hypothetical protein